MNKVIFLLLAVGCAKTKPPAIPTPEPVNETLTIVSMNDFHGALYETAARKQPGKAYGGLPWLVSAVNTIRAEDQDLLLLDGGDVFQGTWPVNQSKGKGAVSAFDLLGVDAVAVGNHEFDYGGVEGGHPLRGALEAAAKVAHHSWLSANIFQDNNEPYTPQGIDRWKMFERKGVKIGVIGLSTQDTPQTTLTRNVADLSFTDPVEAVREGALALRSEGAQVIAVVGHLTGACKPPAYEEAPSSDCEPDGEIGRLLTELPKGTVDLMVLGHAHTLLAQRIGDTFIMENRAKGHAIGRLDLVIDDQGVNADASTLHKPWFLLHDAVDPGCADTPFPTEPLEVGGVTLTPNANALTLIERLEQEAGSLCDRIGCGDEAFTRSRESGSQVGELVADAMMHAMPGADFAIQNSGGLRANLPKGEWIRENAQQVMPFNNRIVLVEMSGTKVEQLFEIGSSGGHGILQISGATYSFNDKATSGTDIDGDGEVEKWEQQRLCNNGITVNHKPVDPNATYKVLTSDFLLEGGDHLGPAFEGSKVLKQGPLLRDAIGDWIKTKDTCWIATEPSRVQKGHCE